jgi:hypothetical protein
MQEAPQVIVCGASSVGVWWITPLVIAVSTIVAAGLSLRSINSAREMARKRATLDFIERSESTPHYRELYRAFTDVRKDPDGLMQLARPTNPQLLRQRENVIDYLNHYEMMAMGIHEGMLDESVYKKFMKSTLVRDWFEAREFVRHLRTPTKDSGSEVSSKKVFCEFEDLARIIHEGVVRVA